MLDIPEEQIDWRSKGFWTPDGALTAAQLAGAKPSIFDGGFTWPLLVVRRSAVEANIATMAAYCARHGMDFAPHAKTTMAPPLIAAQLEAGAWGLTVATPNQALVLRRLGVSRILIANEVLDPTALRWLTAENARRRGDLLPGGLGGGRPGGGSGSGFHGRSPACAGRARAFRRSHGRAYRQ